MKAMRFCVCVLLVSLLWGCAAVQPKVREYLPAIRSGGAYLCCFGIKNTEPEGSVAFAKQEELFHRPLRNLTAYEVSYLQKNGFIVDYRVAYRYSADRKWKAFFAVDTSIQRIMMVNLAEEPEYNYVDGAPFFRTDEREYAIRKCSPRNRTCYFEVKPRNRLTLDQMCRSLKQLDCSPQ